MDNINQKNSECNNYKIELEKIKIEKLNLQQKILELQQPVENKQVYPEIGTNQTENLGQETVTTCTTTSNTLSEASDDLPPDGIHLTK
jgi:hypothetical protein